LYFAGRSLPRYSGLVKTIVHVALLLALMTAMFTSGCSLLGKNMGCMTYENVYCGGRWVCDTDNIDNCQICECMPFYGPDGEPPWQAPGY
jgi:hypothetical protein